MLGNHLLISMVIRAKNEIRKLKTLLRSAILNYRRRVGSSSEMMLLGSITSFPRLHQINKVKFFSSVERSKNRNLCRVKYKLST